MGTASSRGGRLEPLRALAVLAVLHATPARGHGSADGPVWAAGGAATKVAVYSNGTYEVCVSGSRFLVGGVNQTVSVPVAMAGPPRVSPKAIVPCDCTCDLPVFETSTARA